jgi:hypothetical protein
MRFAVAFVVGGAIAMSSAFAASDIVRIDGDSGGQIGLYLTKLHAWRKSGKRVVVDGPCLSACTIVLGIFPRGRICVTSRAQFGFHAAWRPDVNGQPVVNADATRLLMDMYPRDIRDWVARQGGLSVSMKYLAGNELATMLPICKMRSP